MNKQALAGLVLVTTIIASPYALSEEDALCLECHEPAEDWQGMSVDEIATTALDPDIEWHEENASLSPAELKALISPLLE